MDTIFMNSENNKTSDPYRLSLNLSHKIINKYIALSNLTIYYTWKNIKKLYKNDILKISASTWNEKLKLPDGSYSVSDIQDQFKYALEKHGE